ncbi:Atrial natriuretic peptide receptor 1 [Halotydeus destructor]|nr:Atrial natriuretic peptide receptor 1 [Halotydeus destructor]
MATNVSTGARYQAKVFALLLAEEELPYSYDIYWWALKMAVERVNGRYSNLNITITVKKSPIRCDSSAAPVYAAEEYYTRGLDALVGPACTRGLEPVARMASYWKVPVCSPGGIDVKFEDKNIFSTLTRMTFSLDQIGRVVATLLGHFKWHHVALVVDETEKLHESLKEHLSNYLQETNVDYSFELFAFNRNSRKKVQFSKLLRKASRVARIIILVAGGDTVRNVLLEAYELSMHQGDYVFIAVDFIPSREIFDHFSWFRPGDPSNEAARRIFDSLLVLSIRQPSGFRYDQFKNSVLERTFTSSTVPDDVRFNLIVSGAYDCIITYAWALNQSLSTKGDVDGQSLSRLIWNKTFTEAVIEQFHVNENGDRLADFTLKDFNPKSTEMNVVALYRGLDHRLLFDPMVQIHWPNGNVPLDVPRCGFTGEAIECQRPDGWLVLHITVVGICFMFVGAILLLVVYYYKRYKFEDELDNLWWQVRWDDVCLEERLPRSFGTLRKSDDHLPVMTIENCGQQSSSESVIRRNSSMRRTSSRVPDLQGTIATNVGFYKGMRVAVKKLDLARVELTTSLLLEMRHLRDISHENLIRFIGLCPEDNNVAILYEYSPRGSLRDLLQNDEISIDWSFRFCIIADIVEGMTFIHSSSVEYHGRLKSTNCVIDGRFVVKITDFGLREVVRQADKMALLNEGQDAKALLWTAPEHLREPEDNRTGSPKGDVYSFAIILQEIINRSAPFDNMTKQNNGRRRVQLTTEEILSKVRQEMDPPFRPDICSDDCPQELIDLVKACWEEEADQRPSFSSIRSTFRRSNLAYDSDNLLENLLSRMEQYTNNLEQLAEQRTNAFLEEKHRTEELLYQVLPKSIAVELINGNHVEPEYFDSVTICLSDIVGFTGLAAESTPIQVVSLLNELYTCFDATIADYDVYKVETIGDAYMVVSGCPLPNGTDHAREIGRMALALLAAIQDFSLKTEQSSRKVQLRIGIHSGPVAAGVVGLRMPRYCLFGKTVHIAMRMENTGQAMKVHVSEQSKELLDNYSTFKLEKRLPESVSLSNKGQLIS